jgi:3-oxoadipate enol-lactonase
MPHTIINGVNCYYEYENFDQKETIIFSNSLGTGLSMWEKQVDILSHHFNILRYDTRGHGRSAVGETPADIAQLGADVVALLDFLCLKQVVFCGLSMGGLIGQWLGINASERFKKIIISNTAAKIGTAEGWNQRIETVLERGLGSITAGTAERWFTPDFRQQQPDVVQDILDKFVQTSLKGYADCCAAVRDADFRTQLVHLDVPTLVISGDNDAVTTTQDAQFMAQHIPLAKHVSINAAHLSNVEKWADFSTLILLFTAH